MRKTVKDRRTQARKAGRIKERWPSCLHCRRQRPCPNRGLCRKCYRQPAIRSQYPVLTMQARSDGTVVPNQFNDTNHVPPLDTAPTNARPGSRLKMLIMQRRAEEGKQVFHPGDASTRCTPMEVHIGADCL